VPIEVDRRPADDRRLAPLRTGSWDC